MSEKYKNCLFCQHFYFMSGQIHYSEMTPGSDVSIGCSEGYWELDNKMDNEISYMVKMRNARTCQDFTERDGLV